MSGITAILRSVKILQPDRLRARILAWADEEARLDKLPPKAIVGTGERQARRIVAALIERGAVASESTRAPLRLAFPAALASLWMPGLFPERVG